MIRSVKKSSRPFFMILSLILAASLIAGCGSSKSGGDNGQASPNEETQGDAIAAEAQEIYQNRCINCHGRDLEGRVGPNSNLQGIGSRLSVEEIAATIREGRSPMPAFQGILTEEEIQTIAEWLSQQ